MFCEEGFFFKFVLNKTILCKLKWISKYYFLGLYKESDYSCKVIIIIIIIIIALKYFF